MLARYVLALIVAAGVLAGADHENAVAKAAAKANADRPYQIYLLKGLADVFSTGMDFLEAKLEVRGIVGEVHNHAFVESVAQSAIAKWRGGLHGPIIIIGHSLGADSAFKMAQRLGSAEVPVALLVTFSPVGSAPVPANVRHAVNYFQSNSAWHGQITGGPGFHGALENIDLASTPGITHFNIEKVDQLHAATIAKVLALVSTRANAAKKPAPSATLQSGISATSQ